MCSVANAPIDLRQQGDDASPQPIRTHVTLYYLPEIVI